MTLTRGASITWYGHACIEVRSPEGKVILIDPWFSNPLSPRRPDLVPRCDIMLVTHGHADHFGDALSIGSRFKPYWPAIHELALRLGHNLPGGRDAVVGMNKGGTVEHGGIRITMVRADHSAGDWSDALDAPVYLGEPVGFVVELENGFRFYHAGDTDVFSDMRLIAELYRPELAILPIGGHFTMGPREAALAVEYLGVRDVLPIHWGTFPLLAGTPGQLRDELAKRHLEVTVHELRPGQSIS
jgi:L-ascorbate metabolism protein UlaG (beta-lactamase superfamily)